MIENGYYFGFPHREEAYPNSQEESHLVLERMQEPDIEYFTLTDKSPKEPFLQYLESLNLNHKEDLGSYHHGDDMDYSFLKYKESHE